MERLPSDVIHRVFFFLEWEEVCHLCRTSRSLLSHVQRLREGGCASLYVLNLAHDHLSRCAAVTTLRLGTVSETLAGRLPPRLTTLELDSSLFWDDYRHLPLTLTSLSARDAPRLTTEGSHEEMISRRLKEGNLPLPPLLIRFDVWVSVDKKSLKYLLDSIPSVTSLRLHTKEVTLHLPSHLEELGLRAHIPSGDLSFLPPDLRLLDYHERMSNSITSALPISLTRLYLNTRVEGEDLTYLTRLIELEYPHTEDTKFPPSVKRLRLEPLHYGPMARRTLLPPRLEELDVVGAVDSNVRKQIMEMKTLRRCKWNDIDVSPYATHVGSHTLFSPNFEHLTVLHLRGHAQVSTGSLPPNLVELSAQFWTLIGSSSFLPRSISIIRVYEVDVRELYTTHPLLRSLEWYSPRCELEHLPSRLETLACPYLHYDERVNLPHYLSTLVVGSVDANCIESLPPNLTSLHISDKLERGYIKRMPRGLTRLVMSHVYLDFVQEMIRGI